MYISNLLEDNCIKLNFDGRTPKSAKSTIAKSAAAAAVVLAGVGEQVKSYYDDARIRTPFYVNNQLNKKLEARGIVDSYSKQDSVVAVTRFGGDFSLCSPLTLDDITSKSLILGEMNGAINHYGIKHYVDLVNDFKRGDIIKKGLRVKDINLISVEKELKDKAAFDLSRYLDENIHSGDLFCMNGFAYYYDRENKTVYSVKITEKRLGERDLRTCKFYTDKNGNAIGFDYTEKSYYSGRYETKRYMEQQEKTRSLKDVAHYNDYQEYAEANRFGNVEAYDKYFKVIEGLITRLKDADIRNVSPEDIKIVWTIKNGAEKVTLNYYDARYGITRVFNTKGQYVDFINYMLSDDGKFLSCFNAR